MMGDLTTEALDKHSNVLNPNFEIEFQLKFWNKVILWNFQIESIKLNTINAKEISKERSALWNLLPIHCNDKLKKKNLISRYFKPTTNPFFGILKRI